MMTRAQLITIASMFSMIVIAGVTFKVFFDPESIPAETVKAYAAFIGACGLAGLAGLVKLRRPSNDDDS